MESCRTQMVMVHMLRSGYKMSRRSCWAMAARWRAWLQEANKFVEKIGAVRRLILLKLFLYIAERKIDLEESSYLCRPLNVGN